MEEETLVWGLSVDEELSQISEFLIHLYLHFLVLHCLNVNHFGPHPSGLDFVLLCFSVGVRVRKGFLPNSLLSKNNNSNYPLSIIYYVSGTVLGVRDMH